MVFSGSVQNLECDIQNSERWSHGKMVLQASMPPSVEEEEEELLNLLVTDS
jgi:hypothetical protein